MIIWWFLSERGKKRLRQPKKNRRSALPEESVLFYSFVAIINPRLTFTRFSGEINDSRVPDGFGEHREENK